MTRYCRLTCFMLLVFTLPFVAACTGIADQVTPVPNFELPRYLGRWYEIARLDHAFERGLTHITADYSLRDDGGVKVVNRGYDEEAGSWEEAQGKAYFVKSDDKGYLKVSFFGPFYGSYVIFELDENYQWAFVTSYNKNYLWLLSRTPQVQPAVLQDFLSMARELGYDTDELIYVRQEGKAL